MADDPATDPQATEPVQGGPGDEPTNDAGNQPSAAYPDPSPPVQEPAEPQGVKLEKITIAGKEYELTPELAETLRERELAFSKKLSEQDQELGDLRQRVSQSPSQSNADSDDDDQDELVTRLLEKPREVLAEIEEHAVDKAVAKLRAETNQKAAEEQFWNRFYGDNEDLKGEDMIVKAAFQQALAESPAMGAETDPTIIDTFRDRVADRARREVLRIMQKGQPTNGNGPRPVQGGNPPSATPDAEDGDDEIAGSKSMGEALKARRERRRQAQHSA